MQKTRAMTTFDDERGTNDRSTVVRIADCLPTATRETCTVGYTLYTVTLPYATLRYVPRVFADDAESSNPSQTSHSTTIYYNTISYKILRWKSGKFFSVWPSGAI